MNKRITNSMKEEINNLYESGMNMIPITKKLHVCLSTVAHYVEHPRPQNKNNYADRYKEECKETSLYQVGQKLKITEYKRMGNTANVEHVVKGKVIFTNKYCFTVEKFKNGEKLYPVNYKYTDILIGDIEAMEVGR